MHAFLCRAPTHSGLFCAREIGMERGDSEKKKDEHGRPIVPDLRRIVVCLGRDRQTDCLVAVRGGVEGDEGCVPELERIQFKFIFTDRVLRPN
jgi:hypothetical protein